MNVEAFVLTAKHLVLERRTPRLLSRRNRGLGDPSFNTGTLGLEVGQRADVDVSLARPRRGRGKRLSSVKRALGGVAVRRANCVNDCGQLVTPSFTSLRSLNGDHEAGAKRRWDRSDPFSRKPARTASLLRPMPPGTTLTDIALLGDLGPVCGTVARRRGRDDGDDLVDLELAGGLGVAGRAVDDVAGARERKRGGEADEAWSS